MSRKIDGNYAMYRIIREYFTEYLPDVRNCSDYTIDLYRGVLNNFLDYVAEKSNVSLQHLDFTIFTNAMVKDFLLLKKNEDSCSPSTCNIYLSALRSFVHYAATRSKIFIDIEIDLNTIPAMKTEIDLIVRHFSKNALISMLQVPDCKTKLGRRNFLIMFMLYETGARLSEILNLRINEMTLHNSHPFVTLHGKGRKVREVPISIRCAKYVDQFIQEDDLYDRRDAFLFHTRDDVYTSISSDTVQKAIGKIAIEARKTCSEVPEKVTPHMFRHSRAMHIYEDGSSLTMIQQFLGHTSLKATNIYAYASSEMKRKAIEQATTELESRISDKTDKQVRKGGKISFFIWI